MEVQPAQGLEAAGIALADVLEADHGLSEA
jgi:hypothetical protein